MLKLLKRYLWFIIVPAILAIVPSCVQVKPYQKVYLNDDEMQMKARIAEFNEINAESYREGASGANGGKAGGGCGCN